jgi:hypothetical protein
MEEYCSTAISDEQLLVDRNNALEALDARKNPSLYTDCKYYNKKYNDAEIEYTKEKVLRLEPNGKPFAIFIGLCDVPKHRGGHSLARGGSCNHGREFPDNNSVAVASSIAATMKPHIQWDDDDLFGAVLFNSRPGPCPLTSGERKCPRTHSAEAQVKASTINILIKHCNNINVPVWLINLGGDQVGSLWNSLDLDNVEYSHKSLHHMCCYYKEGIDSALKDDEAKLSKSFIAAAELSLDVQELIENRGEQQDEEIVDALSHFGGGTSYSEMGRRGGEAAARKTAKKRDTAFKDKVKELEAFAKEHGHCNVPFANPQLGKWVDNQRLFHKKGSLSDDRVKRLDDLGFQWKPKTGRPKSAASKSAAASTSTKRKASAKPRTSKRKRSRKK